MNAIEWVGHRHFIVLGILAIAQCGSLPQAALAAPTYSLSVGPNQVVDSPVPVSASVVGGARDSAFAGASYGTLRGGSHTSVDVAVPTVGTILSAIYEDSNFRLDNIVLSGPPDTTVEYSINVNISGGIGGGVSGDGNLYYGALVRATYGTSSFFGGFGNVDIGSMSRGPLFGDTATGMFGGFPVTVPGQTTGASPVHRARAGDTISISMGLHTTAISEMRFGGGPAFIEAFASFEHTVGFATSGPLFNLPPGWTANSDDGRIVDNHFVVPEPSAVMLLVVGIGGGWPIRRVNRSNRVHVR